MKSIHSNFILAIGGGSGSGKTSLCRALTQLLPEPITLLSQDHYYRDLSHLSFSEREAVDFDHPDAIEFDLMVKHLQRLKNNQPIHMPLYDFKQHNRNGTQPLSPASWIIVEGILIFSYTPLREMFDFTVYIDVPEDLLVLRRLKRDLRERGRSIDYFEKQYTTQTRPAYFEYVKPYRSQCKLVLDGTQHPLELAQQIVNQLNQLDQ